MKRKKRKKTARQARITPDGFQVGQMWKIGDVNLAVTAVGKTLVHYKRYKTQPKGVQTTLCSKLALEKYLTDSKAILVTG